MKPSKTPERIAREALIDSLEVGDLIELNGKLRVVRGITRYRNDPRIRCITMAIRTCSWTGRPTTTRNRFDLYLCRLRIVKRGYGVARDPLSILLQRDIELNLRTLECCDVIGVVD